MKVFLSSTAQDLVAYHQVADDTILRLSQQSVAMERLGPLPVPPATTSDHTRSGEARSATQSVSSFTMPGEPVAECERKARESDLVVCIVAHRYGFVPEKGRGSITWREVEAAKAGNDALVWVVADDHPWTEKKEQDLLTDPNVLADPRALPRSRPACRRCSTSRRGCARPLCATRSRHRTSSAGRSRWRLAKFSPKQAPRAASGS